MRGYLSAYDAETGKLAWKTYTVPGDPSQPGESEALRRASSTWSGRVVEGRRRRKPWDCIVYDPDLDLVYVGTGNGSPWYDQIRSKGDNLYIASIIALRADTGEQVWHYQTTPGDNWDYDATQPLLLATLTIDGQQRRVLMQANKNGFFTSWIGRKGRSLSATPYTEINWATGIDSNGRPIENAAIRAMKDATIVRPSTEGAHNWHPISFNPSLGLCTSTYWIALRSTRRRATGKLIFTTRLPAWTELIAGRCEINGSRWSRRDAWSHGIRLPTAKCGMLTSLFREAAER